MKKLYYLSIFTFLSISLFSQYEEVSTDSLILGTLETNSNSFGSPLNNGGINSPDSNEVGRKIVFWVHGLAGNAQSWNQVQSSTEDQTGAPVVGYPERNVEGYALSYSGHENLNIFDLGTYVNNNLMEPWRKSVPRRDTIPINKNFMIAHSQGGIVARAIRHKQLSDPVGNNSQFGALATFGSPHGGAKIINSTKAGGGVQKWINEGCLALTSAEIRTFLGKKWWLDGIISPAVVSNFSNYACAGLNKTVFPLLVNSIRKPVGASYSVGGSHLAILDSTAKQDTMKVVTFYGVEAEPVLWRTIHSMTYTKDSSMAGNILSTNPFGLNDDSELTNFVNNKIADYYMKSLNWRVRSQSINSTFSGRVWLYLLFVDDPAAQRSLTYQSAAIWLATANTRWKRFIGARRDTSYIKDYRCRCFILTDGKWRYSKTFVQSEVDCYPSDPHLCSVNARRVHTIIDEPNDGVVTVSSQTGYPNRVNSIMMENTNHMQERNSEVTKRSLLQLFDGQLGREFALDKK